MEYLQFMWEHFIIIANNPKYIWATLSAAFAVSAIILLIRIHLSETYKNFNLLKIFAYGDDGKPSATKIRLNVAFVITCWAFVYLTMMDKLTEWFVLVFVGAWVSDNALNKGRQLQELLSKNKTAEKVEAAEEESK